MHLQLAFCLCKVHITLASSFVIGMTRFIAARHNAPQIPEHIKEINISWFNIFFASNTFLLNQVNSWFCITFSKLWFLFIAFITGRENNVAGD
jgi:hypothetical protein